VAADIGALCDDLAAETAVLETVLAPLTASAWSAPTPAAGWSVHDQITHLAYFDEAAATAVSDPDTFRANREAAMADVDGLTAQVARLHRGLSGPEALAWLRRARAWMVGAFGAADATVRVPWFGPDMSLASTVTSRIMETWAHGQDVADALGVRREPTARLRHVAHIGISARAYSYVVNDRQVPSAPIRVELAAPDGSIWTWGASDADDRVTGPALDFCLAVTQRRHPADTALQVSGPTATEWMSFAQAYAGPAGTGRGPAAVT
jgi:uncharacterized protein (TIGR03084 family)